MKGGLKHRTLHRWSCQVVAASVAVLSMAIPAVGQDAGVQAVSGKPIYLYTRDTEIHGAVLKLAPDAVTIAAQGTARDIRLSDITRIDAPGDSVKNGTLIGAMVAGVWCAIVCPQGLDGYSSQLPPVLLVNVGLGALIGAGIDGMHVGRTTIYQRDELSANRRLTGAKASLSVGFKF